MFYFTKKKNALSIIVMKLENKITSCINAADSSTLTLFEKQLEN